ncbi:MAG: 2-oxo acid dehydrogenase subunit E2 [Planctomycetota bacterium]|jgi:pyruvate dehydrogenase E2 component (dihydrolipoamide acetyltransferase)
MKEPPIGKTASIPITRIQKLIGKRMSESKRSKPCFYIQSRADVTELMGLRPKLSKSLGTKITSNSFLIRALALAAEKYPLVIGVVEKQGQLSATAAGRGFARIRIADAINVGFAVNAPQGLVVPVISQADEKSLAEIARLEKTLTEKARSNKLTLDDMEGETIALSNLGAYGIDSFIGIVPPPASTILAVGNVVQTVTARDGKPQVRKLMSMTLAADHRVIDGAYAADFLGYITEQLENPRELV